jgi:hypothetical protein
MEPVTNQENSRRGISPQCESLPCVPSKPKP